MRSNLFWLTLCVVSAAGVPARAAVVEVWFQFDQPAESDSCACECGPPIPDMPIPPPPDLDTGTVLNGMGGGQGANSGGFGTYGGTGGSSPGSWHGSVPSGGGAGGGGGGGGSGGPHGNGSQFSPSSIYSTPPEAPTLSSLAGDSLYGGDLPPGDGSTPVVPEPTTWFSWALLALLFLGWWWTQGS